jgi:hypothetical protein
VVLAQDLKRLIHRRIAVMREAFQPFLPWYHPFTA